MKKLRILNSYNIIVGENLLSKLPTLINLKKYSSLFLIIDKGVEKHWSKKINSIFPNHKKIILKSGEQVKNITTVQKIWQKLFEGKSDRKTLVVNIGGGVILDMGGFAASTFMRGVDFLQIPTTLLAQVDASLGGKTGINFAGIKNLIGTFQQPIGIIVDTNLLSTLPKREFISGFGEIIKHGVIADKKYFQFVTLKKPQDFTQDELIKIIEKSCRIKADIVAKDPKENSSRKLLNFGHTIGHALESLSQETNQPLLHGEAVSIGIIAESKISKLLGLLSDNEFKILEKSIINAGLPIKISHIPVDKILEKIKSDKKNEKGKMNWTLLQNIGKAITNQHVDDSILRQAL